MTINTTIQDEWVNSQNMIYRKNNLVFAVVLKNASTWAALMLSHNGFTQGRAKEIDWHRDHVFGFIQDPWTRRIKGITEDLLTFYSVEQYLLNNLGKNFWLNHLVFGPHSIPLSLLWHDKMYQIDWIPIDHPRINLDLALEKLFLHHGMEYQTLEKSDKHRHKSDTYQSEIFKTIQHITGHGNGNLHLMLSKDIDFYNTVIQNFDFDNNDSWNKISWLENISSKQY